jgi:hypothetical protein
VEESPDSAWSTCSELEAGFRPAVVAAGIKLTHTVAATEVRTDARLL